MTNTTWDILDCDKSITLSNNNLTAIVGATGYAGVRTVDGFTSGQYYFEITIGTSFNTNSVIGICTHNYMWSSAINSQTGGVIYQNSTIYNDGTSVVSLGSVSFGNKLCIAVDLTNSVMYMRINNGDWNGSETADPATNTGGISVSTLVGSPWFPTVCLATSGDSITANFGNLAFTYTIPSGFTSGYPSNSASLGDIFSPTDKSSNLVLSNNSLTVNQTGSPGEPQYIRTSNPLSNDKFYFEFYTNDIVNYTGAGLLSTTATASGLNLQTNKAAQALIYSMYSGLYYLGTYYNEIILSQPDGANGLGSNNSGATLGFAIDITDKLAWVKLGDGYWNASDTANPATATGGLNLSTITNPITPGAIFESNDDNSLMSINTSSQNKMAVPEGFTSGWTPAPVFSTSDSTLREVLLSDNGTLVNASSVREILLSDNGTLVNASTIREILLGTNLTPIAYAPIRNKTYLIR